LTRNVCLAHTVMPSVYHGLRARTHQIDSKLTIQRMYDELYTEKCNSEYGDAYSEYGDVSSRIYRRIFTDEFNLGFYKL